MFFIVVKLAYYRRTEHMSMSVKNFPIRLRIVEIPALALRSCFVQPSGNR